MTRRGATLQGGLACFGLVLAYTTWQREPERAPGEVVVLEASKGDIQKIHYEDGQRTADFEMKPGDDGPHVILKLSASPDGKTPARTLRGNEAADKFFASFAPLRAMRALGTLDGPKLKEVGLEATKKKLEVQAGGQKLAFLMGTPGFGPPYLKDQRDGRVYLATSNLASDLDTAQSRFVERALHELKATEFDALTIAAGGKRRELVQSTPENQGAARLAPKSAPQKPDDRAKNWHDRLWRMMPIDVLGEGEAPAGSKPEIALRIDYLSHGKPAAWIEVARVAGAPATASQSSSDPSKADIYARSEHTIGWVKLPPQAEELLKEAGKVISGE